MKVARGMVFFVEDLPGIRKSYLVLTDNDFGSQERSIVCPVYMDEYTDRSGCVNFAGTGGKNFVVDLNGIKTISRSNFDMAYFNEAISRKIMNNVQIFDDIKSCLCSIFNITPIVFVDNDDSSKLPFNITVNVGDVSSYASTSQQRADQIESFYSAVYDSTADNAEQKEDSSDNTYFTENTEDEFNNLSERVDEIVDTVNEFANSVEDEPIVVNIDESEEEISDAPVVRHKRVKGKAFNLDEAKKFIAYYKNHSVSDVIKKYGVEYGIDSRSKVYNRVSKAKQLLIRSRRKSFVK